MFEHVLILIERDMCSAQFIMPKILDIPTHMKGLRGERKKGVLYYTFIMLESIFHFTNGYNIFLENYFNTSKTPFPRHVFQNNISICLLVCKILKTLKYYNQLIFMLATRVVFVPLTKVLVESSKKHVFMNFKFSGAFERLQGILTVYSQ